VQAPLPLLGPFFALSAASCACSCVTARILILFSASFSKKTKKNVLLSLSKLPPAIAEKSYQYPHSRWSFDMISHAFDKERRGGEEGGSE
jgi:hypothetical protein